MQIVAERAAVFSNALPPTRDLPHLTITFDPLHITARTARFIVFYTPRILYPFCHEMAHRISLASSREIYKYAYG